MLFLIEQSIEHINLYNNNNKVVNYDDIEKIYSAFKEIFSLTGSNMSTWEDHADYHFKGYINYMNYYIRKALDVLANKQRYSITDDNTKYIGKLCEIIKLIHDDFEKNPNPNPTLEEDDDDDDDDDEGKVEYTDEKLMNMRKTHIESTVLHIKNDTDMYNVIIEDDNYEKENIFNEEKKYVENVEKEKSPGDFVYKKYISYVGYNIDPEDGYNSIEKESKPNEYIIMINRDLICNVLSNIYDLIITQSERYRTTTYKQKQESGTIEFYEDSISTIDSARERFCLSDDDELTRVKTMPQYLNEEMKAILSSIRERKYVELTGLLLKKQKSFTFFSKKNDTEIEIENKRIIIKAINKKMYINPNNSNNSNTGGKNSRKAGKRRSVKGKRSKKSSKKSSKRTRRRRVRK